MTTRIRRKQIPSVITGGSQPVISTEPDEERFTPVETGPTPLPWLTIEVALYGVIFMAALALRLWRLGAYPLSSAEAAQSLTALSLYRGHLPEQVFYSPLLVSLNAPAFLLFGPSDTTARLASVLLGSLLVVLPLTLRRQLGAVVCLLAAGLLALSPTAIFFSRTLNSEIGVAAGSLMLVVGFFNWAEDGRRRWLLLAAGGLALLLTAGPMAYSVLVVFALIGLTKIQVFKELWYNGLQARPVINPQPVPFLTETVSSPPDGESIPDHPETAQISFPSPNPLTSGLSFFFISLILLATAATFNLGGLGQLSSLLTDWLSRFSLPPRADAGFNAVFLLTTYEPLWVLAGLAGLAFAILDKNLLKFTFAAWFIGLLVLDVMMFGRPVGNILLPLIPLAFLAAMALAELGWGIQSAGSWGNEGLLLITGLVIGGFAYIGLTGWILRTCAAEDTICQYAWIQPLAALILFVVIVIFFWFMSGPGPALRGAALAGVALGLLVALGIGWRLNYGPLMNLAYQPLAGLPASTELVTLTDTLALESAKRADGEKTALDTTLVGLNNPALLWRLRDYTALKQINSLVREAAITAIITPVQTDLGLGQPYLGQDFALDAVWSPVGLSGKQLVNWLIFRRADVRPQGNQAILWLRVEGQ